MHRRLLVGLTGGIAAGKSTVAGMFAELGAALLDADRIAHEVLRSDPDIVRRVVEVFGIEVLDGQGRIMREALADRVFSDAAARRRLEAITHPVIAARARQRVTKLWQAGQHLVFYEAALLVESGRYREMDLLLVVVADDGLRIRRLMQRNGLSRAEAERRLLSQMPQEKRASFAHYVIDNSGSLQAPRARVREIWEEILKISAHGPVQENA